MIRELFFFILLVSLSPFVNSQAPATDILIFDLKYNEEKIVLENPTFISSFNHGGYNNQPHFLDEHTLLISSNFQAEQGTDIYIIDLLTNKLKRFTRTRDGEYSPILNELSRQIESVRQESQASGTPAQWLWSYPYDRSNGGQKRIESIDNIGYFCPLSQSKYALYLVTQPSQLIIYDIEKDKKQHIAYDVGRCIKRDVNDNIIYVHKMSRLTSQIRSYSQEENRSHYLCDAVKDQDDFELLPNGQLITADGLILKSHKLTEGSQWKAVYDLSELGLKSVSRIASSKNKIAVVVSR